MAPEKTWNKFFPSIFRYILFIFLISNARHFVELLCFSRKLCPGARFSKLPVITGPVKLFCFPFQMGVSKGLKITH